jgi:hypothetical protein
MALYCLIGPGGSPGVTTSGLALALNWPREVVLAECDPAGRRILPGYLAERIEGPPGPGLFGLAMALGRDLDEVRIEDFTIPLDEQRRAWLLHGIRDPRHSSQLIQWWQRLADLFTDSGIDVIADLGRIGGPDTPVPLLTSADLVVMVLQPNLVQVDAARARLDALLGTLGGRVPVELCLIDSGPYSAEQVSRSLFGLPVLAQLPYTTGDARVLSDGARPRFTFRTCLLMRAAVGLGQEMRKAVEERAFHPDALPARSPTTGGER